MSKILDSKAGMWTVFGIAIAANAAAAIAKLIEVIGHWN